MCFFGLRSPFLFFSRAAKQDRNRYGVNIEKENDLLSLCFVESGFRRLIGRLLAPPFSLLLMATKIHDELKEAIRMMPEPAKDKLLLRLVAKDELLVRTLQHQLLEDETDKEEQRNALAEQMRTYFASNEFAQWSYTPGLAMMELRNCSGTITRHVKVTKDKYGEVQLLLLLVNLPFRHQRKMLDRKSRRSEKFALYVVKKAQMILKKLARLDEDYYIEFEKDVNEMLGHLSGYPSTAQLMNDYDLPPRWEY